MRVLICGGVTGGHFYPGYAIAKKLMKDKQEIVFIVKKKDGCIETLKQEDIPFAETDITSFPRSINPFKIIKFCIKFVGAFRLSNWIIKDFRPDIVISTGGYISFPPSLSAKLNKIPLLLHESNIKTGLANRLLAPLAGKVAIGLTDGKIKSNKYVLTGTPLREEFYSAVTKNEARDLAGLSKDKKIILIFGGSQGAEKLNKAVVNISAKFSKYHFVHLTGKRDFEKIKKLYPAATPNVDIMDYSDKMHLLLCSADLVISRSGASTIAELLVTKTPAILIPFPYAAGNHQFFNAKVLTDCGAASLIKEEKGQSVVELESNILKMIEKVLSDDTKLNKMAKSYEKITSKYPENSVDAVLKIIKNLTSLV